VDGLELEFEGQLNVIRVDIQSETGSQLTNEYGSRVTPTFIFFDASGAEQWRSFGSIDAGQVRGEFGEE
jgi:thioredoxin-related protein